jgi:hypothetical protein
MFRCRLISCCASTCLASATGPSTKQTGCGGRAVRRICDLFQDRAQPILRGQLARVLTATFLRRSDPRTARQAPRQAPRSAAGSSASPPAQILPCQTPLPHSNSRGNAPHVSATAYRQIPVMQREKGQRRELISTKLADVVDHQRPRAVGISRRFRPDFGGPIGGHQRTNFQPCTASTAADSVGRLTLGAAVAQSGTTSLDCALPSSSTYGYAVCCIRMAEVQVWSIQRTRPAMPRSNPPGYNFRQSR